MYKYKAGFQRGHSTVHQLIEIYNQICTSLDNREHYCMVFCDVSKAFDRVWHRGLLLKLEMYGIQGELLDWFSSYISNRNQSVFVNGALSKPRTLKAGVPRGSVLGPFLFIVYVNEVADKLNCITRLFADDTSLGDFSKEKQLVEKSLNENLASLSSWAKEWLINYNPEKTEAMMFSLNNNDKSIDLYFNGCRIKVVDFHKHLGLTFSSNGGWSHHIDYIVKKTSKMICALRKLKYLLNRNTLDKIYKMFIRPHFEYACEVWDGCFIEQSNKLERLQMEAARIVTGLPKYTPSRYLYYETGWELLSERRRKRKLCLFYKINQDIASTFLKELLPPSVGHKNRYNLRNSDNYCLPFTRLRHSTLSFVPSTIKLWNSLSTDIRESPSISAFRSKLTSNQNIAPHYFSYGIRKLNVIHTRLRYTTSTLNYDLYRINIKTDPVCQCGFPCENAVHYFLDCPLYIQQRKTLFAGLKNVLDNRIPLDINLILYGNTDLSLCDNEHLFKLVHLYIGQTKRFA